MPIEIPLNSTEVTQIIDKRFEAFGSCYELISAKVKNDTDASSFGFSKTKCLRLIYVQVSGSGLETISLKQELEKIADFASLTPRKVVSRLELFQSPALILPRTSHHDKKTSDILFQGFSGLHY